MPSYKDVIRKAEIDLEAAEKSMQLAKMFMLELTNEANINLYMHYGVLLYLLKNVFSIGGFFYFSLRERRE